MSELLECGCVPIIEYFCSEHRKPNQCPICNQTKELIVTGMGIICKDCYYKNGGIW